LTPVIYIAVTYYILKPKSLATHCLPRSYYLLHNYAIPLLIPVLCRRRRLAFTSLLRGLEVYLAFHVVVELVWAKI